MREDEVLVDCFAKVPVTVKINSRELFEHLCRSLHCSILVDENVDFLDKYKLVYTLDNDNEEHLEVHDRRGESLPYFDETTLYDERGELYEILLKLGTQIIPNWHNRIYWN